MKLVAIKLAITFFLLVMSGCTTLFGLKPEGSWSSEIQFNFYKYGQNPSDFKENISSVSVAKVEADGSVEPVWWILGKKNLSSITYGITDEKLKTQIGPLKPERGTKYSVSANASFFFARGIAATNFEITE